MSADTRAHYDSPPLRQRHMHGHGAAAAADCQLSILSRADALLLLLLPLLLPLLLLPLLLPLMLLMLFHLPSALGWCSCCRPTCGCTRPWRLRRRHCSRWVQSRRTARRMTQD
jgi:hypothetical protein